MARLPKSGVARFIEAAGRFAARQPSLAGMLGVTSDDPDLERVREGVFFLGAAVTDQIRHFEADGYAALADIAAADLRRPFPAASIVEFSTTGSDVTHVESGAELHVQGNATCRFRIVGDLDVGPVRIDNSRIESEERRSLRFDLVSQSGTPLARSAGNSLRLFIAEPRETALLLLSHILSHTSRLELRLQSGETLALGGIQARGFGADDLLAPEPDGVAVGSSLVREYFLLPEKFLLLDVIGIAKALGESKDERAMVIVRFDAPVPQRVLVTPEGLSAHCAPVVNLFPTTAEPAIYDLGASTFLLRVAGQSQREAGPYAVLRVSAAPLATGGAAVNVPPLGRFGAAPVAPSFPYLFATKTERPLAGQEPETSLVLTATAHSPPALEPHAISVELLATNRQLGASVRPGELSENGSGMPASVRARNIVATSPYVPVLAGPDFILRTFARAEVPRPDPRHVLQGLLYSLVPSHAVEAEVARALRARIRAVETLDVRVVNNRSRTRRGYEVVLTIDETPFNGTGDVALFCRVVHQLLNARASLNGFFTCEAICTKSGIRLTWPTELPA
jgi:type VI secretion system protein ImpG